MRSLPRSLALLALLTIVPPAEALELAVAPTDSSAILGVVSWPDPLPEFVLDRLERGIPATVGIQIDLWRERRGWYDTNVATWTRETQIMRDPWTGRYRLREGGHSAEFDSLSSVSAAIRRIEFPLPIDSTWCDPGQVYRASVTGIVRPLTAQDLREVETWLTGELGGGNGGLLGVPRGVFGIVRDLTGLGDRKERATSGSFILRWSPGTGIAPHPATN